MYVELSRNTDEKLSIIHSFIFDQYFFPLQEGFYSLNKNFIEFILFTGIQKIFQHCLQRLVSILDLFAREIAVYVHY